MLVDLVEETVVVVENLAVVGLSYHGVCNFFCGQQTCI